MKERVILGEGVLQASLLSAWIRGEDGRPNTPVSVPESFLQKAYGKRVRLIIEVIGKAARQQAEGVEGT